MVINIRGVMTAALVLSSLNGYASASNVADFSTSLDYAQVTSVVATQSRDGNWCFDTTVRHNDEGWGHYADGWEVLDLAGNQLGYRHLVHPHDNEQPFTRGLCGISIPKEVTTVVVRARCNVHGYGGKAVMIDVTPRSEARFSVND
ncbi:hypothetical protein ACE1OE_02540 [Vibrio sp. E150_011]